MAALVMTHELLSNAIIAALTYAGKTAATEAVKKVATDAYERFKSVIQRRSSVATEAVLSLEADPESIHGQQTLREDLTTANAANDPEIASAAQLLLEAIRSLPHGEQHIQSITGSSNAMAYGANSTATSITTNNYIILTEPGRLDSLLGLGEPAQIARLAAQANTSTQTMLGFLRTLKMDDVAVEQLPAKLEEIARLYLAMMDRLAVLKPEDVEAREYIERARQILLTASSQRDYEKADNLLRCAEDAQDDNLELSEALEREAHEAARRLRRDKAATRAERAQLSLTRLHYLQAADHYHTAASLLAPEDAAIRRNYLLLSANALQRYGDEKGDNAVLHQAIVRYGELLSETPQASLPFDWAATLNNLGNALSRLGERESETSRLEEAVVAYRSALEERTREQVPLDWAMTQNNLGTALSTLGERESGTSRLEEAVAAYRSALEERTRERVPLNWAATQNNLGTALSTLGDRESGTSRLEEAVTAYRSALEEYTREQVPLDWAMTQNNLGTALSRLGDRESGTSRLEEAVTAYRSALEERTRERVPLGWAQTQSNLGNALKIFGEREENSGQLREAKSAIASAWEVSRKAGMHHYDKDFETRLAELDTLIARFSPSAS